MLGGICILDFFTEDEIKERVRNYMWGLAGKKPSQNNYITIEVSDVMQIENVNDTVTENNDSEPENNKSLSIEIDSSKSIIDTLSQFGFEYIDNEASSEIIWVIYDNTKNDIIEEIKTIYKKQIILEKRGSVKTNNRAAWRIMCKNQGKKKMADIKYEIINEIGVISTNSSGWNLELNRISWNGNEPKYDLRTWAPNHEKMGKGVTLTEEELKALCEVLKKEVELIEE